MNITDEILNDEHFEYNINTGYIYSGLCQNWDRYPRDLFKDVEWKLESILWYKKKVSVPYSDSMKDYLDSRRKMVDALEELRKNPTYPPYLDYFMQPQDEGFALIAFNENCLLKNGEDSEFDYFFALKLTILDLMDLHEFLDFQLSANFKEDTKKYKIFLQTLLIKYKDLFRPTSISEVVNNYMNTDFLVVSDADVNTLEKLSTIVTPAQESDKKEPTGKDDPNTRAHVIAMFYLLDALNCFNIDVTNRALFIQFFTGKEKAAKSIKNTNIYKYSLNPFGIVPKEITRNLKIIRPHFVNLGLTQVVNLIDKRLTDIHKPKVNKQQ